MKVAFATREYPPEVYGGAGVYAEHLVPALRHLVDLTVHCFGSPRLGEPQLHAYQPWDALDTSTSHSGALRSFAVDLTMSAGMEGSDLVHTNTWYTNMAGHLAKLLYGIPHVATAHSLEPLRSWKAEQLGGGYAVSSFCERTALQAADAVIAVSQQMRNDVLSCYPAIDPERVVVVHNGIDTSAYRPVGTTESLEQRGVDPARPTVTFVGRITRQKGIVHLLNAARHIPPPAQIVLCAASPDTPEIARDVRMLVTELQESRGSVIWINEILSRPEMNQLLSHATAFVCPSVYEPFGLVNVEAMACGTAVVATRTGGIPEIVIDGHTGVLVSPGQTDPLTGEPEEPEAFARDLARAVNRLLAEPELAQRMGRAGRIRATEHFSWNSTASQTVQVYRRARSDPRPAGTR